MTTLKMEVELAQGVVTTMRNSHTSLNDAVVAINTAVDDLIGVCRKAGGYINIGLEKLSKGNRGIAEEFIMKMKQLSKKVKPGEI